MNKKQLKIVSEILGLKLSIEKELGTEVTLTEVIAVMHYVASLGLNSSNKGGHGYVG